MATPPPNTAAQDVASQSQCVHLVSSMEFNLIHQWMGSTHCTITLASVSQLTNLIRIVIAYTSTNLHASSSLPPFL